MTAIIQSYHLIATLVFVAISAVVAVRLLLLARRTGCKPELLLGLGLLGTAVLGYGVLIAAALTRGIENPIATTPLERGLQGVGTVLHDLGVSMMILFVVTVFRPAERWARALAALLLASLWVGGIAWELENGFRSAGVGNGFWVLRFAVVWAYPLWPMFESYRYYALMRRRLAVGLVDPLVANRFLLWGTGSLGTALAIWTASTPFFLTDRPALALAWSPVIEIATATFGIVTVVAFYLTFFPPAAYRRWIETAAQPAG